MLQNDKKYLNYVQIILFTRGIVIAIQRDQGVLHD